MRIRQVRAYLLSYAFPEPIELTFYGGRRTIVKRDAMLIRVEADNGLVGYAPGPASERAEQSIRTVIAPFLEGRVLADPDALRVQFLSTTGAGPRTAMDYCAVEVALYDLVAKERGVPLSEMLGGRERDRIRLYGSAGMYMPAEKYAEEAAAIADMGFSAYKMRPALGPEEDVRTVQLMREAVGPGFDLMIDAHAWWRMGDRGYSFDTVRDVAAGMAEHEIAWLEEPLPPDDHQAYLHLKALDLAPLASGEHEPNEEGFLDLIRSHAVDYVQMDVCCQGGFSLGRRLFSAIAAEGLRFAFHSWGNDLEVIAAAQVGICWPETVVEWLEYPCYSAEGRAGMYPFPLSGEILAEPLQIEHGCLTVPRKPGLGFEVNESVIERYPWIPGPWSYYHIASPAQTLAITSDHNVKWQQTP
jgi:L-alanine-DL-glutamate epimerase-like enolase superfamily enzyme